MLSLALDTIRRALRTRGLWVLLALGFLIGWAGLSLAILALGDTAGQAGDLIRGTALTWAGLLAAWVLTSSLDQDHLSDLGIILDATGPGQGGRLLGRWLGAAALGAVGGLALAVTLDLTSGTPTSPLSLLSTTIVSAAWVGAWALFLASSLAPGVAFGITLALWVLGHLPWGSDALLPGTIGHVLHAVLPHPVAHGSGLVAALLVVLGLLGLTVAGVHTGSMLHAPGGGRTAGMR